MSDRSDYPAAHSMDTMWFAVDRDGHVAAFESGEAGAVPSRAYLGEDYGDVVEALLEAGGKVWDPEAPTLDADGLEAPPLAEAGVYVYGHDERHALAAPYLREQAPATPLTGDRVPRGVLARMVAFDGRFAETERLQPAELWPSEAWGAAYLSSDGATVRCLPGREAEYVKEMRAVGDDLGDVTIEPPVALPPEARVVTPRAWWKFWRR